MTRHRLTLGAGLCQDLAERGQDCAGCAPSPGPGTPAPAAGRCRSRSLCQRRVMHRRARLRTKPLFGLISRIGLAWGPCVPRIRSCSRLRPMSPAPATRHAGLSVSRLDRRTSLTAPGSAPAGGPPARRAALLLRRSFLAPRAVRFRRPSTLGGSKSPLWMARSFLPRELGQALHHPLVHRVGEEQHVQPALAQRLHVRALLDRLPRRRR